MSTELIIAFFGVIAGLLGALLAEPIRALVYRRKGKAETHKVDVEARSLDAQTEIALSDWWQKHATEMEAKYAELKADLDGYRSQTDQAIDVMRSSLASMRSVLARVWEGVRILMHQLCENNIIPRWKPDDDLLRECQELLDE